MLANMCDVSGSIAKILKSKQAYNSLCCICRIVFTGVGRICILNMKEPVDAVVAWLSPAESSAAIANKSKRMEGFSKD